MSIRPSQRNIVNRGTSSAVTGIISAAKDSPIRIARARPASSSSANPASEATSTASGTVSAATISELTV